MDLYLEELKRKYAGARGFKSAVREVRESLGLRPDTFRSWKGLAFVVKRKMDIDNFDYFSYQLTRLCVE